MSDELERYEAELELSVDLQRKQLQNEMVGDAKRLIEELKWIIYNREVDDEGRPLVGAREKLSAIGMILDRTVPKLGVQQVQADVEAEDGATSKKIKAEIREMLAKELGR